MPGVRNGVLAAAVLQSSGWSTLLTAAPGFTILLKTVHLWNVAPTSSNVTVKLVHLSSGASAILFDEAIATGAHATWEGWSALNPDDQLQVDTSVAPLHVWIAGADLPGMLPTD
jgi:accessory colonization factor AcfC